MTTDNALPGPGRPVTSTIVDAPLFRLTLEPSSNTGLRSVSQIMVDWGRMASERLDGLALRRRCLRSNVHTPPATQGVVGRGPLAPRLLFRDRMDVPLVGTAVLGAISIPYVVEVLFQVRLLALFLTALPAPARAALPPHRRRPSLAFVGSTRFFFAVWRSFRRDLPDDPPQVIAVKRRMRLSLWRELIWGTCFVATLVALLVMGWRPIWP